MTRIIAITFASALAACSASQVQTAVADGALICQIGSAYTTIAAASGQTVFAKGAAKSAVDAACGLVNGVAVALPVGSTPGSVTVALPPSVTVPLG